MKSFYSENKNIKQVNAYLKKIGLSEFMLDEAALIYGDFEFDGWINAEETRGVSVRVEKDFTVFASKYTKKDIEEMEAAQ